MARPFMSPIDLNSRFYHFARVLRNYGNPLSLVWQKQLRGADPLEVVDRATGLRFLCRSRAFQMFGEVFHLHLYDVPWIPIRLGDTVIDIGANHGFYSLYAAQQGARVYAFEPQRDTFELLRENVRRNGLQDRVITLPLAVAATDGQTTLEVTAELAGGMSSINPAFIHSSGVQVIDRYEVETIGLDGFLRREGITNVRLLKLDCEGSELLILRTLAPETWSCIDGVAAEVHPEAYDPKALFDVISATNHFQIGTLDTHLHYGVGSDILLCAATGSLRANLSPPFSTSPRDSADPY